MWIIGLGPMVGGQLKQQREDAMATGQSLEEYQTAEWAARQSDRNSQATHKAMIRQKADNLTRSPPPWPAEHDEVVQELNVRVGLSQ